MSEPRYMSLSTLASVLDVGESTIEGWIAQGSFPVPKKVGPNGMRRWSWREVERLIEGPPQDNTASDLLGRITNAAREASRNERGIRKRHQGLPGVPQIRGPRLGDATELPSLSDPSRTS